MACASSDINDTLNVLMALCRIVRPCHQWRIQNFFKGARKKLQLPSKKFWGSFLVSIRKKNFNSPQHCIKTILWGCFRGGSGLLKGGPTWGKNLFVPIIVQT